MAKKRTAAAKPKVEERVKASSDVCFVIMPFGGWLDKYYEDIYVPAIESAGLEPHRADDLFRPSTIVNDIWAYTKRAKLLLADLTDKNPNVFYELGLAHALAKPVILVAESMADIPFDLRALRIITYDKNAPNWGEVVRGKVKSSIREVLKSPAEAVLPAFLEVKKEVGKATVSGRERDLIEIKQELELLRREMRSRSIQGRYRPPLDPEQASDLIRDLLKRGMHRTDVLHRLRLNGVPENFVSRELQRVRGIPSSKDDPPTDVESALDTDEKAPKTSMPAPSPLQNRARRAAPDARVAVRSG